MENRTARWSLLGSSMNQCGVVHFTLYCRDVSTAGGDYEELITVLKREFSAMETGELQGPYSVHKYLDVAGLVIGLILDSADELELYARDERDRRVMDSFIGKLLNRLNSQEHPLASDKP